MQGDFNLDGQKTVADVQAMMNALCDLPGYQSSHQNMADLELLAIGDLDRDGNVTNADFQSLLCLLANNTVESGGALTQAVPEPSTSMLALSAAVLIASWQRRSAMKAHRSSGEISSGYSAVALQTRRPNSASAWPPPKAEL